MLEYIEKLIPIVYIKSLIYQLTSNSLFELYVQTCVRFEPILLFLASYFIVCFIPRVAFEYKKLHPNVRQTSNAFSLIVSIISSILNIIIMYPRKEDHIISAISGFTIIICLFLSFISSYTEKRYNMIHSSIFVFVLTFVELYYCNYIFILFFLLSIPIGIIRFRFESKGFSYYTRLFISIVILPLGFIGIFFSNSRKPRIISVIAGIAGCLFSFVTC